MRARKSPLPVGDGGAGGEAAVMTTSISIVPRTAHSTPKHLTWDVLIKHEPALTSLMTRIRSVPVSRSTDAINLWYGRWGCPGFKAELEHLVGWGRRSEHPILSTSSAYNVAYQTLFDALERRVMRAAS